MALRRGLAHVLPSNGSPVRKRLRGSGDRKGPTAKLRPIIDDGVSSFTSVSLDPPLVSLSADVGSRTWPELRRSPMIGLGVLSAPTRPPGAAPRPGSAIGSRGWRPSRVWGPHLRGAAAPFRCTVDAEVRAGDVVVLTVAAHAADPATSPLVFHGSRFHRLADREHG